MKKRHSILVPFSVIGILLVLLPVLAILFFGTHAGVTRWLLLGTLVLIIIALIVFYVRLYMPLSMIFSSVAALARGKLPKIASTGRQDEIGFAEDALHAHSVHLEELVKYAGDLSEGKAVDTIEFVSEEDQLSGAMLKLKTHIERTREEMNQRHTLDEQQNWAAKGLAKFSQLLRGTEENLSVMSGEFIREVVRYLDVEAGGLFLSHEGQEKNGLILKLTGAFAFDRQKNVSRSFRQGEGLVGRCALEKETIVITDLPPDYIRIRSGLGEDQPAALVLVPVLLDDQVLGIIEVASFEEIPRYKIEFLENLSNTIASVLIRIRSGMHTTSLLARSREQAEDLMMRDEEMKQTIEELKATQEESAKREEELRRRISELEQELQRKGSR